MEELFKCSTVEDTSFTGPIYHFSFLCSNIHSCQIFRSDLHGQEGQRILTGEMPMKNENCYMMEISAVCVLSHRFMIGMENKILVKFDSIAYVSRRYSTSLKLRIRIIPNGSERMLFSNTIESSFKFPDLVACLALSITCRNVS
jgi:hypothetical protein